jgi:hypothetical protein
VGAWQQGHGAARQRRRLPLVHLRLRLRLARPLRCAERCFGACWPLPGRLLLLLGGGSALLLWGQGGRRVLQHLLVLRRVHLLRQHALQRVQPVQLPQLGGKLLLLPHQQHPHPKVLGVAQQHTHAAR